MHSDLNYIFSLDKEKPTSHKCFRKKKKRKCEFVLQARCQSFWKKIAKKKLNLEKKTSEEIQSKLAYFHVKKKYTFIYLQCVQFLQLYVQIPNY